MEPTKLRKFDSLYDGNMKLAIYLVGLARASDGFTKIEYPGQEEFYDEYLTKFEEYAKIVRAEAEVRGKPVPEACIEGLRESLEDIAADRSLTPGHLIFAYVRLFRELDLIRGVGHNDESNYIRRMITAPCTAHGWSDLGLDRDVVPFTSTSGAFGINTFLYMFFNKVYPIGITPNVYPVHGNLFYGSIIRTVWHDFDHINNYDNIIPRWYETEYKMRDLYTNVLRDQDRLGEGKTKAFLYVLFYSIHEKGAKITCSPNEEVKKDMKLTTSFHDELPDAWPFFYRNPVYGPSVYGYDLPAKAVYGDPLVKEYLSKAIDAIFQDLCSEYGDVVM